MYRKRHETPRALALWGRKGAPRVREGSTLDARRTDGRVKTKRGKCRYIAKKLTFLVHAPVHAGRLASQAELSRWKDRLQTAPVCFVPSSSMWHARRSANKRAPGWQLTRHRPAVFTVAGKRRRLNGEFLDGATSSSARMRGICGRLSCGGMVKEVETYSAKNKFLLENT